MGFDDPPTDHGSDIERTPRQSRVKRSLDITPKPSAAPSKLASNLRATPEVVAPEMSSAATSLSMSRRRLATNIPALDSHLWLPSSLPVNVIPSTAYSTLAPARIPHTPQLNATNPAIFPSPLWISGSPTPLYLPATPTGQITGEPTLPPPGPTPIPSYFRYTLGLPWLAPETGARLVNRISPSLYLPFTPDEPFLKSDPMDAPFPPTDLVGLTERFQSLRVQALCDRNNSKNPSSSDERAHNPPIMTPTLLRPRTSRPVPLRSLSLDVLPSFTASQRKAAALKVALASPILIHSPQVNGGLIKSLASKSPLSGFATLPSTKPSCYFCL